MVKNYRIRVIGKVQGVWFRKYTKEAAEKRSILGYVSNENDGSVFIEAQGHEHNLEAFVDWLYLGSPLSSVETVRWEEGEVGDFENFDINR